MATAAASARSLPRVGHGWVVFAGTIILIAGVMNVLNALWAFDHNDTRVDSLLYSSSLTRYGWLYLLLGIALIVVGVSIFRGAEWASWAGIVAAGISMLLNMAWIFAFPIPSLVLILLDTLVLYGLVMYGPGAKKLQYEPE